jgi:hypothetical protein
MTKEVIVGHVCIDQNQSEGSKYESAGSPAMFMATIFDKLGDSQTTIVSHYGPDYSPYLIGRNIYPPNPTSNETLIYQNISHGDKRSQKVINVNSSQPVEIDSNLTQIIESSDALIVAPILPNYQPDYINGILNLGSNTTKVLLPQGYFRDLDDHGNIIQRQFSEAPKIVPLFDIVILSIEDHKYSRDLAEGWANDHDIVVVLTLGSKGCQIFTKDRSVLVETTTVPEKEIKDSVGSGDIFTASFIHQLSTTKDPAKSAEFANKVAGQMLAYTPEEIKDLPKITS